MKKYGLIGKPISHSLSPALFKAGYDGMYRYDLIETEDFDSAYRRFLDEYEGINVTAPYKEKAFDAAEIASPECRRIGAANLLVKTPEGVKAYNTDYYGVMLSVLEAFTLSTYQSGTTMEEVGENCSATLPPRPTAEQAQDFLAGKAGTTLIVGCGGAGKAAAFAAIDLGLKLTLMNRTPAKAEALAQIINAEKSGNCRVESIDNFVSAFLEADIIVYTLPEPLDYMASLAENILPEHLTLARGVENRTKIILEANYKNPSFTPELLEQLNITLSSHHGVSKYIPGSRWLLYQAYAGYELFTGLTPSLPAMSAIL